MSSNNKKPKASVIFIFGGSGDLNQRKLTPALYNLFIDEWMPANFAIIGLGRTKYTDEKFREHLSEGIQQFSRRKEKNGIWQNFSQQISYMQMDAEDEGAYQSITERVQEYEKEWNTHPNVIFYLAVAPQLVPDIAKKISHCETVQRYTDYTHRGGKAFWS